MNIDLAPLAGKKLLCAVSGGADSMCLLHLLTSQGLDVTAAHFEHGIRGEESLRDAAFVEAWCRARGIPFVLGHGDAPAYARAHGMGLEEAARELRYRFLRETMEESGAELILTAHNRDDNAETVLLNLIRGSGTAGLSGIPPARGAICRPLLGVSRREITAYLSEHGVPHVEDSSNESEDYTRNLLRHRVVPLLREINPRFSEAAARTARLARRDEDCLSALAGAFLESELRGDSVSLRSLCSLHPAIASRAVRQLFPGLSMERCEAVLDFARGRGYGVLELPGRVIRREQGRLYLSAGREIRIPDRRLIPGEGLSIPELGLRIETERVVYRGEIHDLFKTSYLKYEIVSTDLLCTGRRPGDSLRPLGRGVRKSLSALFKEAGFTRERRDSSLILRDGAGPLFVRGLALDERARPRIGGEALKLSFTEAVQNP
ncbi:MAG: tRNA lysidine(34) synthetase TilS [Oscillospiraceae bacterium]|nr:tRNA lysidine(34) synthetase TilS [Oscillospiraceae bacterium]